MKNESFYLILFFKIDGIRPSVWILHKLEIARRQTERLENHVAEVFELSHHLIFQLLVSLFHPLFQLLFFITYKIKNIFRFIYLSISLKTAYIIDIERITYFKRIVKIMVNYLFRFTIFVLRSFYDIYFGILYSSKCH